MVRASREIAVPRELNSHSCTPGSVQYVQFKAQSGWIKDTNAWSVSGHGHPNGPVANVIAPCSRGMWNAGGTPQPWAATIELPAAQSFSGFRFADAFPDEDHLRSFKLEAADSPQGPWRPVLRESGLPNHRAGV